MVSTKEKKKRKELRNFTSSWTHKEVDVLGEDDDITLPSHPQSKF